MSLDAAGYYKTKKDLKAAVGQRLRFEETSAFGSEFNENGRNTMVGPFAATKRVWYATITTENGVIKKVA